eukprot:8041043-Alexandrium_andersonii.AAC.1
MCATAQTATGTCFLQSSVVSCSFLRSSPRGAAAPPWTPPPSVSGTRQRQLLGGRGVLQLPGEGGA